MKHNEHSLLNLSDTQILLNFSDALAALYPYMFKISAHCNDAYDDIIEDLFLNMVHYTFAEKYGVILKREDIHMYEMYGNAENTFRSKHRIEVSFRRPDAEVLSHGKKIKADSLLEDGNRLVFINFGDGIYNLTMEEDFADYEAVHFNKTVFIVLNEKGVPLDSFGSCWVNNEDLKYKFVLKD